MDNTIVGRIKKSKCTGCKACGDICPRGAIVFVDDEEGFWYPTINEEKCIQCGKCVNVCPLLSKLPSEGKKGPVVYAAWSKHGDVRRGSTSGGVFWEIATRFLKNGGVVCGCRWNNDYRSASHYIAHNIEELRALQGSKYIQSDTSGIYRQIRLLADNGKKILFCGTPCQNAALFSYLGKEYDDRVYYLDFICRSINSPLAFREYVKEMEEKHSSKIEFVQLKNKKKGWRSLATYARFENGEEWLRDRNDDYWINGFIGKDLYTRDSCSDCQFRTLPRLTSNITVGDFWGIKGQDNYDMYLGISVVMINDDKGKELLSDAEDNLIISEKTIEDVLPGNPALVRNTKVDKEKKKDFFDGLKKNSFSDSYISACGDINKTSRTDDPELALREDIEKYKNKGEIDESMYIDLNFQSKNVIHKGRGRIITFRNSVIDLDVSARIIMEGDEDFLVGTNVFKNSKAETRIRMSSNAYWIIKHGGYLFNETTLDIKKNAVFESGFFSANTGSVIVCAKYICFGEDVMIGRNVIIYDSDFHQIGDYGNITQGTKPVIIEDHVWLTGCININKGARIGEGSIIANQTVINKEVPKYSLVAGKAIGEVIKTGTLWKRSPATPYVKDVVDKRIILFGYGEEGRKFYSAFSDRIEYVIDNYAIDSTCISFNEFIVNNPIIDEDSFFVVIAALNSFDEIFDQIRSRYLRITIVSAKDYLEESKKHPNSREFFDGRIRKSILGREISLSQFKEDYINRRIILFGYGIEGKRFHATNSNKIDYVIDNYSKDEICITFMEFCDKYSNIVENDYYWVIASPNYYDGIYKQIRSKFANMLIVSSDEVMRMGF